MIVSIKDNKYQIFISSTVGLIVYLLTKNEIFAFIITLITTYFLRKIQIDKIINKKI